MFPSRSFNLIKYNLLEFAYLNSQRVNCKLKIKPNKNNSLTSKGFYEWKTLNISEISSHSSHLVLYLISCVSCAKWAVDPNQNTPDMTHPNKLDRNCNSIWNTSTKKELGFANNPRQNVSQERVSQLFHTNTLIWVFVSRWCPMACRHHQSAPFITCHLRNWIASDDGWRHLHQRYRELKYLQNALQIMEVDYRFRCCCWWNGERQTKGKVSKQTKLNVNK